MPFDDTELGRLAIPVEFDVSRSGEKLKQDAKRVGQEAGRLTAKEIRSAEAEWDRRYSGKSAEEMAKNTVRELKNQYRARVGEARAALVQGVIDRKEFVKQARLAARDANNAILLEMQRAGKGSAEFGVLAQGLVDVEKGAKRGAYGVSEMRESFASLLAQIAGVHPVLGRIVNVFGSMALGSVLMAGVLGALAAVGAAWRHVTEKTREAREATENAWEQLQRLRDERTLGPGGDTQKVLEKVQDDLEKRRQALEAAKKALEDAQQGVGTTPTQAGATGRGGALPGGSSILAKRSQEELDQLQEDYDKKKQLVEEGEAAVAEAKWKAERAIDRAIFDRRQEGIREQETEERKRQQERERAEQAAGRAAGQLESIEADVRRRLAALTASATDDLLLQIDNLEAQAREAAANAGQEISQEFLDALDLLRSDARGTGELETWQEQLRQIMRADRGPDQQGALEAFIASMRQEVAALREGSKLRKQYQELLERAEDLHHRNAAAIAAEAAAEAKRKATFNVRDRAEELRDLRERARLLEENARAALQLANAIGVVSDETASALENIAQLGSSVVRVAGGDLSAIPSLIGSVAQLAKGIFGGKDAEELRRQMVENARRLQENTEALKAFSEAALSNLSGADRQSMIDFWNQVITGNASSFWGQVVTTRGATAGLQKLASASGRSFQDIVDFLQKLEDITGSEFFDLQKNTLDLQAMADAWDAFMNKDLGAFDQTLGGALDALSFYQQVLGESAGDASTQLQRFLDVLGKFDKAGSFADALASALAEGGAEGANAFIDELAKRFAAGDQSLFGDGGIFAGLTPDEVRRLLEEGNSLVEDLVNAAPGTGTTQDFIQARSITEITGTRIEGALYSLEALASERNDLLRILAGDRLTTYPGFGGGITPGSVTPSVIPAGGGVSVYIDRLIDGGLNVTAGAGGLIDEAQLKAQVTPVLEQAAGALVDKLDRMLADKRRGKLSAAGRAS